MKKVRQSLYINFFCPTIRGLRDEKSEYPYKDYYNPHDQSCYIFYLKESGEVPEDLIQCINHAQLHYIIQVIEGTSKSYKFDNVAKIIRKRNKEIYEKLF